MSQTFQPYRKIDKTLKNPQYGPLRINSIKEEKFSSMNIFVCVKQVPDTETKIRVKADGSGISETNDIKWIMNPYDEFAVEEALEA